MLLLFLSALPVVLLGLFIYSKDKHKEPLSLLTLLFFSGLGSIIIALVITSILQTAFPFFKVDTEGMDLISLSISVFIGVALIEEFSKWIMVYLISYKSKHFDEFFDMLQYAAFVALGFAFVENVAYVFGNGLGVAVARALSAVPHHFCDGVFMGYYLGLAKIADLNDNKQIRNKNLILSLIVPIILHGIYDYCVFSRSYVLMFFWLVFIIIIDVLVFKKVKRISKIDRKMKYKENFCPNCGTRIETNFCPNCGRENE